MELAPDKTSAEKKEQMLLANQLANGLKPLIREWHHKWDILSWKAAQSKWILLLKESWFLQSARHEE